MELITIQLSKEPIKYSSIVWYPAYSLTFAYFNDVPTGKEGGFFKNYFHTFISAN